MLSKIFKVASLVLCTLFTTFAMTGCGVDRVNEDTTLLIATGGAAGTYYPIGGAIAEVLAKNGIKADPVLTGASVANINVLKNNKAQLAIIQNDIAHYAINGEEMFKDSGKVENLQGIASLYPETCQLVVRDESGVKSISDLKSKKVAVGAQGSGAEANARQIMEVYGLTYSDIEPQYLSFAEASVALKSGDIDAAFLTAGYPTASVQALFKSSNSNFLKSFFSSSNNDAKLLIKLISLDDEHIKILTEKYPFYVQTTIPSGSYNGFNESVKTVSVMAILAANNTIDESAGEKITKYIFENTDEIIAAHSTAKNITKETALDGMDFIKMNDGALKILK